LIYEITKKLYNSTVIADFFPIEAKNMAEAKAKVIKHYNLELVNPPTEVLEFMGFYIKGIDSNR